MRKLLGLSMLLLFSCHKTDRSLQINQRQIGYLFEELGVLDLTYDIVIIIPVNGCSGCRSKALYFALEGAFKDDIKFIISSFGHKDITFNVDQRLLSTDYVFVDGKGLAITRGLIEYFPVLFIYKGDELIKKIEMNALNIDDVIEALSDKKDMGET